MFRLNQMICMRSSEACAWCTHVNINRWSSGKYVVVMYNALGTRFNVWRNRIRASRGDFRWSALRYDDLEWVDWISLQCISLLLLWSFEALARSSHIFRSHTMSAILALSRKRPPRCVFCQAIIPVVSSYHWWFQLFFSQIYSLNRSLIHSIQL